MEEDGLERRVGAPVLRASEMDANTEKGECSSLLPAVIISFHFLQAKKILNSANQWHVHSKLKGKKLVRL